MNELKEKLFNLQNEIGKISKESENPFFHSKYFDINQLLDVLKPKLKEKNLLLLQPLTNINGQFAIKTILIDIDSENKIENITPLTENTDPQKMGSAITYFRRYSLQSLFGLQAMDDDGNRAAGESKKEKYVKAMKRLKKEFEELDYSKEWKDDFDDYKTIPEAQYKNYYHLAREELKELKNA